MSEMFENAMTILGVILLTGIPIATIVYFIPWKEAIKAPSNQFDTDRQVANLEILKLLVGYAIHHPTQRFGQILRNTGILQDVGVRDSSKPEWETPDYYIDRVLIHEEPQIILERMRKELEEQKRLR